MTDSLEVDVKIAVENAEWYLCNPRPQDRRQDVEDIENIFRALLAEHNDAGRYRFLRDSCDTSWEPQSNDSNKLPATMIDAAIDAAIRNADREGT